MTIGTIFLLIFLMMLLGAVPLWPYNRQWGYGPSGSIGAVVVVLLILVLMGKI